MRRHVTIIAIAAAACLAACGKPASEAARDNAAVDQTSAAVPRASTDLPAAPSVPGNPNAAADPAGPAGPAMTPPAAAGTEYNNGAGNSNTGAGNDGSAGTKPSGTNNETGPTKK